MIPFLQNNILSYESYSDLKQNQTYIVFYGVRLAPTLTQEIMADLNLPDNIDVDDVIHALKGQKNEHYRIDACYQKFANMISLSITCFDLQQKNPPVVLKNMTEHV